MALLVIVTVPKNKAQELAKIILKKRLCACVNIIENVKSFFWWNGKIDKEEENLLFIKTKNKVFKQLKKCIKENHPYTVCEIIAFNIDKINKEYLKWLEEEINAT
jgi:periplasmic divalent cation tolerance protein